MVSSMTMPRFNRAIRPVNSRKHIIDLQLGLPIATKISNDLALAVDAPVVTNVTECKVGANVNSIFLNVQFYATSTAALANIYMYVWKNPGSNIAIAQVPNANATGASDMKKLIFHTEMNMSEKNTTAIPRTLFKGVLKLPRHMRRFGQNDQLKIELYSPGVTHDVCIQCIYKEYF